MFTWRRLGLALLLVAAAAGPARPQDALPLQLQATLLLKALSYDRALDRHGAGEVVVAVVYDGASGASAAAKTEFVRAVKAGGIAQVNGRPVRLVEVNAAAGQVGAALRARSAVAAYLTAGLDERLPAVVQSARESAVTTLGGSEGYARRGVAVAVDAVRGRPQLFVNLPAARAAGADLPTTLLQLATVLQ